jgi:hypothetical protein
MTTQENYLELIALSDRIDTTLKSTDEIINAQIIKYDFLTGYKNGIGMMQLAANDQVYDDKKPETMVLLAERVKKYVELYKENINNAVAYPLQTEQSKEQARGQVAGIAAASKILFNYDVLKAIDEDIAYFKMAQMPNSVSNNISCHDLLHVMTRYVDSENAVKEELKVSLESVKESIFEKEFVMADHNALREQSVAELYPELGANRGIREYTKQCLVESEKKIQELTKIGIENNWSLDGYVIKSLIPDSLKGAKRVEWEKAVTTERESLKNKTADQVTVNNEIRDTIAEINKNLPAIEQHMRDSFKPEYSKSIRYSNLIVDLEQTDKNIKRALEIQKIAAKTPGRLIEVKSLNPADIINDEGIKKQLHNIKAVTKTASKSNTGTEIN